MYVATFGGYWTLGRFGCDVSGCCLYCLLIGVLWGRTETYKIDGTNDLTLFR